MLTTLTDRYSKPELRLHQYVCKNQFQSNAMAAHTEFTQKRSNKIQDFFRPSPQLRFNRPG